MTLKAENNNIPQQIGLGEFILKFVSGAMRGTEIPIRKNTFTIGRSSEADIQIKDTLISKMHCKLTFTDDKWFIEDCGSTNGSWMVGQKIDKKSYLPQRTSIRIGKTIFELYDLYVGEKTSILKSVPESPSISYRIEPKTLVETTTSNAGSTTIRSKSRFIAEENKRLSAVYKFQNIISSVLEEKELYNKIISAISNVIPVDKAYLLLYDLDGGGFTPVAGRTSAGIMKTLDASYINMTISNFVKDNREAVLSIDKLEDRKINGSALGINNIMTSTMCIPMLGKQQINGMLYFTLTSPTEKYTEDDLRLVTVMGHTAGMAIEHSNMMEFNLKNERLVATGATAAGLSHYIKNILAGLDGSLNLLRLGIDEEDFGLADEAWNILQKNHRRLGTLVLDLLNLASEQNPNFSIHNVNHVIHDVVELLETQFLQEGISLVHDPEIKDIPLYAEVDAKGIHRVLLNLVTNAEQAIITRQTTMSDDKVGSILISANFSDNKEYVMITVTDDGTGLEIEDSKQIFDLFITSKGAAGTGLGLAVCKRLVEGHGGSITVSSEKNIGSTFAFSLPVSHNEMNTATRTIKRIF